MGLAVKLQKRFDGFELDVAFEASSGITVLFGYSGSGKTLTLQMISGLHRPAGGWVTLGGTALYDSETGLFLSPQKRRIAYIFQDDALFPHMTVKQNIVFGGRGLPRQQKRQCAEQLIRTFRLEGLENRYPRQVSGGQKQRVAFARALMQSPGALLLDEPFSALDNPIRIKMRNCLAVVMRELQIPVILVTHDLVEALSLADRLIIYAEGRIQQMGTPSEVVSSPANEEVASLVDLQGLMVTPPSLQHVLSAAGISARRTP